MKLSYLLEEVMKLLYTFISIMVLIKDIIYNSKMSNNQKKIVTRKIKNWHLIAPDCKICAVEGDDDSF